MTHPSDPGHRQAVAETFRDAVDVFATALDAAMDLLREVDPPLAERAESYGVDQLLDISVGQQPLTQWLTDVSIALDGRDLQGQARQGSPIDEEAFGLPTRRGERIRVIARGSAGRASPAD